MKSKVKRKKVYFITVVIGLAICMVGVIFGSRLVFQRTCERRTTPWSDLGTADDDEYRILIDASRALAFLLRMEASIRECLT